MKPFSEFTDYYVKNFDADNENHLQLLYSKNNSDLVKASDYILSCGYERPERIQFEGEMARAAVILLKKEIEKKSTTNISKISKKRKVEDIDNIGKKRKVEDSYTELYTLVTILHFSWGFCESVSEEPKLCHYYINNAAIDQAIYDELNEKNGKTLTVKNREIDKFFNSSLLEDLLEEDKGSTVLDIERKVTRMYSMRCFSIDL